MNTAKEHNTRSRAPFTETIEQDTLPEPPEPRKLPTNPAAWINQPPSDSLDSDQSPLLNLAPEIRNRIYNFCVWSEPPFKLSGEVMKVPGITFVNRQIRDEFLPIFFAETTFEISTTMNTDRRYRADTDGRMRLRRQTQKLIRATKDRALFRHVKIEVSARDGSSGGYVTIDMEAGKWKVNSVDKTDPVPNYGIFPLYYHYHHAEQAARSEAFSAAVERVSAYVASLAAQENFEGLTINNVVSVTQCFRK